MATGRDALGHAAGSSGYRRITVAMTAAGVATFAQLYAVQAVLPGMADDFSAAASTVALSVSFATAGLAACVLVWSGLADRFGRVGVMTAALVVSTALGLAAPFAPEIWSLLLLRALQGAFLGGVPAVAMAYLAEEIAPSHLSRAAGIYIAGNTVGGMSGRLVAGAVADLGGWRWGVGADSLLAAAALVVFLIAVPPARGFAPRPRKRRRRDAAEGADAGHGLLRRVGGAVGDPGLLALYAHALLLMGAFVTIYNYLGFRMMDPPFGLSQTVVAFLFVAYLAGTVSSAAVGRAVERFGRHPVLAGSVLLMAGGAALLVLPAFTAVAAGLLVLTFFFFAAHTTASAWVGHRARPFARAQAAALYTLAYYLGSSAFGWLGGVLFDAWGWGAVVGFVLALCALALVAGLALRAAPRGATP
ncbi:MFS transporter [Nocardiopsis sp. RSe5-2]|uniref:MFS transporter n=1 Tax=Nocardiopsis endophytica TaxID=3018445 RepID=A0ABT4UBK3_9ACTN|nr:MFS transporter [Nocardiopsis endophytica]MDA2814333.1 MFS transporter [Nocardiopsis endophytica]